MKTKLFFLLVLISNYCFAQITLDHKFTGRNANVFQTSSGIKYWLIGNDYKTITFYNSDYSIYKTIILNDSIHVSNIFLASDKLFNNDNSIEFIVNNDNSQQPSLLLFDENGKLLMNFGTVINVKTFLDGNKTKMIFISSSDANMSNNYYIYSLPGQLTTNEQEINSSISSTAYPNPAVNSITLPYSLMPGEFATMKIFNSNGILINSKNIDSNFDKILLNVESYTPGIYFYSVKEKTNKFIVNK